MMTESLLLEVPEDTDDFHWEFALLTQQRHWRGALVRLVLKCLELDRQMALAVLGHPVEWNQALWQK